MPFIRSIALPPPAPEWSAAPVFSVQEGASGSQSVPVSVVGGASITLGWVAPGAKPAWVTLNNGTSPSISFSGAQVDANDIAGLVLSATANGQTVNSAPGSITVTPLGGSSTPFLLVRTGQRYATLAQVAALLQNGDTVKVASGSYTVGGANDPGNMKATIYATNVTIEWETPGSPPVIDMSAYIAATGYGNGIRMEWSCVNLTVRGIHMKGARQIYADGSAIYCLPEYGNYQNGGDLLVEYCRFWMWSQGISSGLNPYNRFVLRYSTIEDCRSYDQTHGIYMMNGESLTVVGCTFKTTVAGAIASPWQGHLLKSRAKATTVRGSLFDGAGGCAKCMDISNGGQVEVTGTTLIHVGATNYNDDNQPIRIGAEQQAGYLGTGEYRDDGRTHSVKFAQNTIRKFQPSTGNPPYEIINIAAMVNPDGSPATVTTTDGNGSMLRNNIAGSNRAAATNFVSAYPNNTAVADTTISDTGVYSGGVVAGSPAINDAPVAWGGELTAAVARSDTNRGARIAQTALLTASQGLSAGQWLRFRQNGQITVTLPSGDANLLRPYNANILGYFDKAKYDPTRQQLAFIGKDANGQGNHERHVVYDEASDSIASTDTATYGFPAHTGHGYCNNTLNPATGEYWYRLYDAGNPIMYRNSSGAWSQQTGPNMQFPTGASATEWFPEGNVLVVVGRGQLYTRSGTTWTQRGSGLDVGYSHSIAHYSKARGKVYFGGGNTDASGQGVYRLNADMTINQLANCPIPWGCGGSTVTVIEPVTGDLMVCDGSTWYRLRDDGSNGGLGFWNSPYLIGTGGDGKPTLPISNYGTATCSLPAPYSCMAFMRDNGGGSWDIWLYKD